MLYPMGGSVDGRYGDHVLLAPPLIVSDAELSAIVERFQAALQRSIHP